MLKRSSHSVKVIYADKNQVMAQLNEYVRELRASRPEVIKVGFFGSYATNTYGPASDVDLLLVLSDSTQPFIDRIPGYIPENLSVGCDVFPYTLGEIEKLKKQDSHWIRHILEEVIWL